LFSNNRASLHSFSTCERFPRGAIVALGPPVMPRAKHLAALMEMRGTQAEPHARESRLQRKAAVLSNANSLRDHRAPKPSLLLKRLRKRISKTSLYHRSLFQSSNQRYIKNPPLLATVFCGIKRELFLLPAYSIASV